ncbi:MAG: DUF4352 domain-containing protein [Actinomycetota bacterium]
MSNKYFTAGLASLVLLALLIAGCASSSGNNVKSYKIKEEVAVGKSVWKVLTVEKTKQTNSGAKASGEFVFVQLEVKNTSNEAVNLTGIEVELFDGDSNTYQYDTQQNNTFLEAMGKDSLIKGKMDSGETVSGWIAFDIPETAKNVQLRVHDLDITSEKSALIDLSI